MTTGGLGPQKLVLADLDGDDDLDIAMSSGLFERVMSVLLNNGDGTFGAESRYDVGDHPQGIAAADFDRDGDLDLAVARYTTTTLETYVQIWSNDGAAQFARAREVTLIQAGDRPVLVADDFNGKGLGSRLMLSIMEEARDKGLAEIEGLVLANNPGMLKLMKGLGFQIKPFAEDPDFKLVTHSL